MSAIAWMQLVAVALLGTIAQLALKYGIDRRAAGGSAARSSLAASPFFWLWFACYGASALLWLWSLRSVPLSQAFPIIGLQFALVPLASGWLLGEHLHARQWAGVAVIVLGVMLVGHS